MKRSSIKGQITIFINYYIKVAGKPHLSNIEVTELSLKLTKFKSLGVKFDDLQSEIEILNYDDLEGEKETWGGIEHEIVIDFNTERNIENII